MRKVISYVQGGLGNQCFIYAAGRTLADQFGCRFLLDLGYLADDRTYRRTFGLNKFEIRADELLPPPQDPVARMFRRMRFKLLSRIVAQIGSYHCEVRPFAYRAIRGGGGRKDHS